MYQTAGDATQPYIAPLLSPTSGPLVAPPPGLHVVQPQHQAARHQPLPVTRNTKQPNTRHAAIPPPATVSSTKSTFSGEDILSLTRVCVDNNVFALGHGEVGKTWEKVAKELEKLGVKHSVAVLRKKIGLLMAWHEVCTLVTLS